MKTFFRFIFLCISVGLIFFGITNLYLNQQSMHETDDIIKMIESIKTENTIASIPPAKPSKPSLKLTALEAPAITNKAKGI